MKMKMKIPSNFSLRKLLYNKKFTIPFSVGIAFVFWLIIMINQNPVREQTFTDIPVSITLENTVAGENGMDIVSDVSSQKFTVTLSGPNYIVSSLKPEDIILYASSTDVTAPDEYNLEVYGARNSSKNGYTFVSISPATVKVAFDYVDTKEFTITPKLVGVGAADGLIAETPIVSGNDSNTVKIKGPRSVMETIDSVVAYAEVNKTLSTSQTYDAKIQILDASGNSVDTKNLTLGFTSVKVSVPISKKATISVKPVFSNIPAGMSVDDIAYSLDHTSVTIIGTPDIIDKMSELTLSPINFYNLSSTSNSFDLSASLPDGVKILDNIDYFKVSVDTTDFMEKVFVISNVKYKGLASGLSTKSSSSIKNVKICGPKDVIKKITASDIYAIIDLKDKSAGEHTVTAKIQSDTYTNIWQVGTYSTTVTIQ